MKEIVLPVPRELEVQRAIVASLHQRVAPLAAESLATQREIELLREYRSRLVADVVTGKLDVREAAARLPDELAPDVCDDADDESRDTELIDEEATEA